MSGYNKHVIKIIQTFYHYAIYNSEMAAIMFPKKHGKRLCLFYILVLLLWGTLPCAVSVPEMAELVCGAEDCYVNHDVVSISPVTKHFPAEEYLSAREFGTLETMSAAKGRSIRPVSRSVRQIAVHLSPDSLRANTHSAFRQFLRRGTVSHCLCGIIITNYIHHQDGQKS